MIVDKDRSTLDIMNFFTQVHDKLSLHKFFINCPEGSIFTEGLNLYEAKKAIWFHIGSLHHRLSISNLQFIIRICERDIVPPGVKISFNKLGFWPDHKRNNDFLHKLAREKRIVAKEMAKRTKSQKHKTQ
ncbi:MAG: hypothetical protein U5L76_03100 [Patescibacteria group bacterium]|nr:hypothetical protein [Patescibacteria group bacterium]